MRSKKFEMHAVCFPCFVRQVFDTAQYATKDESVQLSVIKELMKRLIDTPAGANGLKILYDAHVMIRDLSGNKDPYAEAKTQSNEMALKIYPKLKDIVYKSNDRLLTAAMISAAGNVVDYLTGLDFNLEEEILKSINRGFAVELMDELRQSLSKSKKVLIIGDNAGEIVCDRVLAEEVRAEVIYAVRGSIFANDVTVEDAKYVGMDRIADIVTTGKDQPLLMDNNAPEKFSKALDYADTIISKGGFNREALMGEGRGAFCMFKAKCQRTAEEVGARPGDIVMIKQN